MGCIPYDQLPVEEQGEHHAPNAPCAHSQHQTQRQRKGVKAAEVDISVDFEGHKGEQREDDQCSEQRVQRRRLSRRILPEGDGLHAVVFSLFPQPLEESKSQAHEAAEGEDEEGAKCISPVFLLNDLAIELETDSSDYGDDEALELSGLAQHGGKSHHHRERALHCVS